MDIRKNMRLMDRVFRYLLGVVLLTWAVAGGPYWAFLGLIPLATAAWGYCPIYSLLKSAGIGRD